MSDFPRVFQARALGAGPVPALRPSPAHTERTRDAGAGSGSVGPLRTTANARRPTCPPLSEPHEDGRVAVVVDALDTATGGTVPFVVEAERAAGLPPRVRRISYADTGATCSPGSPQFTETAEAFSLDAARWPVPA